LPQMDGYRFAVGITCAAASGVEIYAPWALVADLTGD